MRRPSIATGILLSLLVFCAAAATLTKIVELTASDSARLDRARLLIQRYLPDQDSRSKYLTPPGKLGTLRAIMKIEAIHPGRKDLLEAMGIVLGDTFVQDMGFHWVAVESESGRQLAIRYKRRNIILYPLMMISQRINRGERVDILDLYNDIAADVEEAIEND